MDESRDRLYKMGYRAGRYVSQDPVLRHFAWLLVPLIKLSADVLDVFIFLAVHLVSFPFNLYSYRVFRRQFHDPQVMIYLAYSEEHQYEYFLGPDGCMDAFREYIGADVWRANLEAWKQNKEGPRGTPFERHANSRWLVTNMRTDLPFIVVFTRNYVPVTFFLSEPYRKRRRDGEDIDRSVKEIMYTIAMKTDIGE